jgi:hypothetical protein
MQHLDSLSMGCAVILSLTGGWWLMGAIASPAVHAYTGRLAVSLEVQPEETFEALMRRAESVARAAAQRSFDRDILVTNVHIVVSAEHLSRIAPILSLEVTRTQWSRLPDTRRWATYYSNAKTLLGFTPSPSTTATTPPPSAAPPSAAPAASPPSIPSATPTQSPTPSTTPTRPSPDGPEGTIETPPETIPETIPPGRPQIIPDRIPSPVR